MQSTPTSYPRLPKRIKAKADAIQTILGIHLSDTKGGYRYYPRHYHTGIRGLFSMGVLGDSVVPTEIFFTPGNQLPRNASDFFDALDAAATAARRLYLQCHAVAAYLDAYAPAQPQLGWSTGELNACRAMALALPASLRTAAAAAAWGARRAKKTHTQNDEEE